MAQQLHGQLKSVSCDSNTQIWMLFQHLNWKMMRFFFVEGWKKCRQYNWEKTKVITMRQAIQLPPQPFWILISTRSETKIGNRSVRNSAGAIWYDWAYEWRLHQKKNDHANYATTHAHLSQHKKKLEHNSCRCCINQLEIPATSKLAKLCLSSRNRTKAARTLMVAPTELTKLAWYACRLSIRV